MGNKQRESGLLHSGSRSGPGTGRSETARYRHSTAPLPLRFSHLHPVATLTSQVAIGML